jgi:hypothetical protein
MSAGTHRLLLILSILWVLAVGAYMTWSLINFEGVYRWLAEWQMEHWGQYYRKATITLPVLILGLPAFAYLGRRARAGKALAAQSVALQARVIRRNAWITLVVGLVGVAVAVTAFLLSLGQPNGSEPAERIALSSLGSGPVPTVKVRLEGRLDPAASTGLARGGIEDSVTYYAAFRGDDEAKDAPIHLFVERNTQPEDLSTVQGFMPEQTGYLVENGVPQRALDELRGRGVTVASPHYLLKTRSGSLRDPYYITAALGGFIGLICLIVGGFGFLQARRRAWLATAVRPDGTPAGGAPPTAGIE